ncbi:MAG: glycosyltransferase family 39 protein [Thermoleophilia bacterium]
MTTAAAPHHRVSAARWWAREWQRPALAAVLALAALLNLRQLDLNGWGNEYYSAAVRSMTESWSGFLFASFDPGGLVAVDKTPLALWVQALSARVFGYSEAAVMLPQAVAGVASVGVLYLLVREPWGRMAGMAAALCLAVSPVSVAVARDNNPDALLILLLLLAALAGSRAVRSGRPRTLVLAGALVGLAVLTKMLLSLVIVPALVAAYLVAGPHPWRRAVLHLAAAGGATVAVAGAWVTAVLLTPSGSRPWVGSTSDDSILSLLLGYNGVGRVAGQTGGTSTGGMGGGGGAFSGEPGLWRLLNGSLGDQIAWLLPLALAAGVSLILALRRRPDRARLGALVLMGGWFATAAVVLSAAGGIVHTYYVALLAPPLCGLVGAGVPSLWEDARRGGSWPLLPLGALGLTLLVQLNLLGRAEWLPWLAPLVAVTVLAGGAALATGRLAMAGLAVAVAGLLAAPLAWSASTSMGAVDGVFPGAGPRYVAGLTADDGGARGGFAGSSTAEVLAWAEANDPGSVHALIVADEQTAAPLIIDGGRVAAMGGFTGRETVIAPDRLAALVASGEARYFLLGEIRSLGATTNPSIELVKDVCTPLGTTGGGGDVLYDCAGHADELATGA